jgi:hypothetical protein
MFKLKVLLKPLTGVAELWLLNSMTQSMVFKLFEEVMLKSKVLNSKIVDRKIQLRLLLTSDI